MSTGRKSKKPLVAMFDSDNPFPSISISTLTGSLTLFAATITPLPGTVGEGVDLCVLGTHWKATEFCSSLFFVTPAEKKPRRQVGQ